MSAGKRIKLRYRDGELAELGAIADHYGVRIGDLAGRILDGRALPIPMHQHNLDKVMSRVCSNITQLRQRHLGPHDEALRTALEGAEHAVLELRTALRTPRWRLRGKT